MSYNLRVKLAEKLLSSLRVSECKDRISKLLVVRNATRNFDRFTPQISVNTSLIARELNEKPQTIEDRVSMCKDYTVAGRELQTNVDSSEYARSIITDVINDGTRYGHGFQKYLRSKYGVIERLKPEKVLIEYGSPNVAKPLHAGHLRSAIIGQFVANINETLGNSVLRMCYLGDWGTQFGILAAGYKKLGDEKKLEISPVQHLLEVYIKTNEIIEEEGYDGAMFTEAAEFMRLLENNDEECVKMWRHFRTSSVDSSLEVFDRLGVKFDKIESESDYIEESKKLCDSLEKQGLLKNDQVGFVQIDDKKIILKKSNGTTLYLSRDMAAILNRVKKFHLDRLHYVVDSTQSSHFQKMKKILRLLNNRLYEQENLHIGFGRVKGMSTRKGNVVFLTDILDEAEHRMMEIIKEKSTTKSTDMDYTAKQLALSAVYVQDMKEKRLKDYDFDWTRMLSNRGATGPFLQYGHSRLCSLEESFPEYLNKPADFSLLVENEAIRLVQHLSKFDLILDDAYVNVEPHILVHYLLDLVTLSNNALVKLSVKNSTEDLARARMQLFHAVRLVLTNGIKILGLQPLRQM